MIKQVSFFKRKPSVSVEDFQQHWRTNHANLVGRLPGLQRYVQNHTLLSGYARREPVYDGVAEAWFDNMDDMRATVGTAELAAIREDEHNFLDRSTMGTLLTTEVVIIDGPVPVDGVKNIAFLNKRADVTPEFFQEYWRTTHAALASAIPGQRRYVQCHCRLGIYASGRTPVYDGVPMSWFDSLEDLRASAAPGAAADAYHATRADEQNFMASGRLPFVVTSEVEIAL